jgi:methionyl-tRNA synthetase
VLASLAEGIRVVTVLLHPYMPASTDKLLTALTEARGGVRFGLEGAEFADRSGGWAVAALEPLFPKRS